MGNAGTLVASGRWRSRWDCEVRSRPRDARSRVAANVPTDSVTGPTSLPIRAVTSTDTTALIMGGTTIPTWNDADVEVIMNQFIAPTHPGERSSPSR